MAWDIYCAICGCPFAGFAGRPRVPVSWKPLIKFKTRADGEDENHSHQDGGAHGRDDTTAKYCCSVIVPKQTVWWEKLHVLGNQSATILVSPKTFVSGPAKYDGNDGILGVNPKSEDEAMYCYRNQYTPHGVHVFPFHWPCWQLLTRVLTGNREPDMAVLDTDLIYKVMARLTNTYDGTLYLKYGPFPQTPRSFHRWTCMPGEEIFAADPSKEYSETTGLKDFIKKNIIPTTDFKMLSEVTHLGCKVNNDPFATISYDVLQSISRWLSLDDIFNLAKASWAVNSNTSIWIHLLLTRTTWFFELHELRDEYPDLFNVEKAKAVLLWACAVTKPRLHMGPTYLSVANRRRIWGACEQLASAIHHWRGRSSGRRMNGTQDRRANGVEP